MYDNRLLKKLAAGKTSLGLFINTPDMVDLCGHLGFDWFVIDQMWTGNDWSRTEELIRAGEAASITPIVRVSGNPWLGYDHRLALDCSRALGIGAQFVFVSHSCKREIDECLVVAKDWHRKIMTIHPYNDFADWVPVRDKHEAGTFVVPQPETRGALDELEEVIREPGVKLVFIAMTDASRILTGTHTPDFYHPEVWKYVDRAVALGREHGVTIGANTSYAYTLDEIGNRVRKLNEHGVKMIMVQTASFLFQITMNKWLKEFDGLRA